MERGVRQDELARLRLEQHLYGVRLFQAAEYHPEDVEIYIAAQERSHLAEGLHMQQRSVRMLEFADGQVRGFCGQPMVEVNEVGYVHAKRQYLAGDKSARTIMERREHDVTLSRRADNLMIEGEVGDGFFAFSPYAEELDDDTARGQGFWPQFRRSYGWLYRKKSETELECVDISIDQSSVATYKALLHEYGIEIPEGAKSHDLPAYTVGFHADELGRDELVDNLIGRYKVINNDAAAKTAEDGFEAIDFLDKHAQQYIRLLVDTHRAIAESLRTGELHDLVRLSTSRALQTLRCLTRKEIAALRSLLDDRCVAGDHTLAFATLVAAQRYGIWEAVSNIAGGTHDALPAAAATGIAGAVQTIRFIDHIYNSANQAAIQHKTMPGCAGGTSFLQQDEASVKAAIFDGERYSFNKKMYCVVCQTPPKSWEKPKWCGPCGICQPCDVQLKAKASLAS